MGTTDVSKIFGSEVYRGFIVAIDEDHETNRILCCIEYVEYSHVKHENYLVLVQCKMTMHKNHLFLMNMFSLITRFHFYFADNKFKILYGHIRTMHIRRY